MANTEFKRLFNMCDDDDGDCKLENILEAKTLKPMSSSNYDSKDS